MVIISIKIHPVYPHMCFIGIKYWFAEKFKVIFK